MSYIVLEFKTDGRIIKTIQPKKPDYEQQKKAVGGFIETIPYFTKAMHEGQLYSRGTAFANEEGQLLGLPPNRNAMALWRFSCPDGEFNRMSLAGDVIFYAKVKD